MPWDGSLLQQEIPELADCPLCGVPVPLKCDHSRDKCSRVKRTELAADGASHYERMLAAYGKSPEVALQIGARARRVPPGQWLRGTMDALAAGLVSCPRHQVPEGMPCPRGGACPSRRSAAAAVAARRVRGKAQTRVRKPRKPGAKFGDYDYSG